MREKFDIVVVGGGISGCATFFELSKQRDLKIALVESAEIASKTTGESGGYIRRFNTDPFLASLASESFDYYQNFESEVGASCEFRKTGLVSLVTEANFETLKGQITELQAAGHEVIIKRKAPTASLQAANYAESGHVFIYEPGLGNIDTRLACRGWVEAAQKNGGRLFENQKVLNIIHSNNRIQGIETTGGIIEAETIILSAGAWSKALLAPLPIDSSQITARSFQYNIYKGAAQQLDTAFMDNIEGFYTAPFRNGSVFAGTLGQDRLVDNGLNFDHQKDAEIAETLHQLMRKHFSWVDGAERFVIQRSYDAYTDDGRGVVKSFTELPGLILASGWSSGGIKSAPAVARRVSKLVIENQSRLVGA